MRLALTNGDAPVERLYNNVLNVAGINLYVFMQTSRFTIALLLCAALTGCSPAAPPQATAPPSAPAVPTSLVGVAPTAVAVAPPAATAAPPAATTTTAPVPTARVSVAPTLVPTAAPDSMAALRLPLSPPTQSGIGDPYYPQLGNGGYDVQHYTLNLAVDVEHNVISGTATIAARASADLAAFNLDLRGLAVDDIAVNGAPAAYSRAAQELTITPTTTLAAGQLFTTTVGYSGTPAPFISEAVFFPLGWNQYENGIYVASEPAGAATWFPVNDHPLDKATYTLQISVPKPYVVAANGTLQQTIDAGDTTTYIWGTAHPLASYLVTLNIAEYVRQEEQGPNGLLIRNYFPPAIAPQAQAAFAPTAAMIDYFDDLFGPYPFEAYGVAVIGDVPFALETQTLSIFGRNVATQAPEQVESVVAHELAHQWFGDSVSLETWQDIWLNESFATYASWLWAEHQQGAGTADRIARQTYPKIKALDLPPTGNPPADDLFNTGVYERGALVLHALRLTVGDAAFFDTLRTYTAQFRDGNASTPDFIAVAEQRSGQNLDAFFDAWLYGDTLPPLPDKR